MNQMTSDLTARALRLIDELCRVLPAVESLRDRPGRRLVDRALHASFFADPACMANRFVLEAPLTAGNARVVAAELLKARVGPDVEAFARVIGVQRPDGSFVHAGPSDSPDEVWFCELVLAQALSTHAIDQGCAATRDAARRLAGFIHAEIQPDHATNQPWGLPAMLLSAETFPLVELMLHTAQVHLIDNPDPTTILLLTEARRCCVNLLEEQQ